MVAKALPAGQTATALFAPDSARETIAGFSALGSGAVRPAKAAVARKSALEHSVGSSVTEQNVEAGALVPRARRAAKWKTAGSCAKELSVPNSVKEYLAAVGALGKNVLKSASALIAELVVMVQVVQRVAMEHTVPRAVWGRPAR
jgi:hypothetical protein